MNELTMKGMTSGFLVAVIAWVAWLLWRVSGGSAGAVFFGVTVPPGFAETAEGRAARRRFGWWLLVHGFVGAAVVLTILVVPTRLAVAPLVAGLLWFVGGSTAAFLAGRRRVLPFAVGESAGVGGAVREATLEVRRPTWVGGWLGQVGPFVLLAVAAAVLAANWGRIPERFPSHWGIDGKPDGWSTRSFGGVFMPLVMGAMMCLLLPAVLRLTQWGMRRGTGALRRRQDELLRMTSGILLAVEYVLAGTFAVLSLTPVVSGATGMDPGKMLWVPFVLEGAMLLVIGWMVVRYQERVRPVAGAAASAVGDGTPDACWKWGMMYVNREDPAVFVAKRFGIGYTVNLGNPLAWLFMAGMLAFIGVVVGMAVMIG